MTATTGVTRGDLVAELAAVVGVPHEARFIVDEALGLGPVLEHPGAPTGALNPDIAAAARHMAARRAAGEPLQYVFGHWTFRRLDLRLDPRVLIPRPETEQVVEVALAEARRLMAEESPAGPLVAVDAGTGSGAIALSLASELGGGVVGEVWATEASADALAVAAANLVALRSGSVAPLPDVELVEGSWLEPLPDRLRGRVGLVVSNPPYVSASEWEGLDAEVRAEPRRALVAASSSDGVPGLADVEAVLTQARGWLAHPGAAVVELAPHQAEPALHLAERLGYAATEVLPDLARRPRALVARTGGGRSGRRGG
jgi:release factor glutamine methyltransferase